MMIEIKNETKEDKNNDSKFVKASNINESLLAQHIVSCLLQLILMHGLQRNQILYKIFKF